MRSENDVVHRFGPFLYNPWQRALLRDGEVVPLAPEGVDLLQALLRRRGRAVRKSELIKRVWPDRAIDEIGFGDHMALLCRALRNDSERYIRTVPNRGYMFLDDTSGAGVESANAKLRVRGIAVAVSLAAVLAVAAAVSWDVYYPSRFVPQSAASATVAVAPFESLSAYLDRADFSKGLTNALIEEMSKVRTVRLVSENTVNRYESWRVPMPVMTRVLGTDMLLEGSAVTLGARVRVYVRLTDAHSGTLIWAERCESPIKDLNNFQAKVARATAAEVGLPPKAAP
jgi:TolB-like protein/DNA-binding winged helix-turn-helix (wHTH) protein